MKVALVVPTMGYGSVPPKLLSFSDFPAGLGYVASALKQAGHTVIGVNPNNDTSYDKPYYMLVNKLSEAITTNQPDLIGLAGLCTDYAFLKDAIEICRQISPTTPIVLGGGIINNDAEFVFNNLKPDYGIVGDGEEDIVNLANKTPSEQIDNLWYWKDGTATFTRQNYDYGNIDDRPFPDYEPFGIQEMLDEYSCTTRLLYRYPRINPRPYNIVASRGCPFSCTFCVHRGGPKYRARSIPNIMEEIRVTWDKYHYNIVILLDELFAVSKGRLKEFCDALLENKAKYGWDFDWMFQTHASAALDLETLKLAKKAGCFFFSYGLESASPTVLKSMNKRIEVPQIIEAIDLANKAEIGFGGNLIFGDIAESQKTIIESLDFYYKYCSGEEVFLGFLMPYPGNKLFDTCMERGIIKDKADYYTNIDKVMYNMTTLPDNVWSKWINFIATAESTWLTAKSTKAISMTKEDTVDVLTKLNKTIRYKIEADCPYCGRRSTFSETMGDYSRVDWPAFMGSGCQHCNRRIRIDLPVGEKV